MHIGSDETFRLFGTRDSVQDEACSSALADLVRWARKQPASSFALIHIRDWHRAADPTQAQHLAKFGEHCLEGSVGAELVCGLQPADELTGLAPNEHFINVTHGINDTLNTGLDTLIQNIKNNRAKGFLIRVGVIGVSTDFQISNLLYELQSRYAIESLATCSALTAARSRRAHFAALDNIERSLDTTVFHSIADFTFWLAPNKSTVHLPCVASRNPPEWLILTGDPKTPPARSSSPSAPGSPSSSVSTSTSSPHSLSYLDPNLPRLTPVSLRSTSALSTSPLGPSSAFSISPNNFHGNSHHALQVLEKLEFDNKHMLTLEDLLILDNLFRSSSRIVIVSQLAGGFSGALVLLAKSFDAESHEQGPFVLKLGPIDSMAQERINFERIEEIIGNQAPYIYASYEAANRAGMKFAFASHAGQISSTTTFKRTYADPQCTQAHISSIVYKVVQALNRFYSVAKLRHWDLLDSYDFNGMGWALAAGGSDEPDALAIRMAGLLMCDPSEIETKQVIDFGQGVVFRNAWQLMKDLAPLRARCCKLEYLVSFVHGDLNFSNILIDGSANVWLIDFQYTTKAHWLKDLGKLENDAMMECRLENHEHFEHALRISNIFHKYSPYQNCDALEIEVEQNLASTLPLLLQRACYTRLAIRKLIYELNMDRETGTIAYHVTMLRYALHSMCFHHLSHWTRKWALAMACSHAQHIMDELDR